MSLYNRVFPSLQLLFSLSDVDVNYILEFIPHLSFFILFRGPFLNLAIHLRVRETMGTLDKLSQRVRPKFRPRVHHFDLF